MNNKTILKIFFIATLAILAFVGLGPARWQPRSGLGWELDHFAGYFVITAMCCLAWPRPLLIGGILVAFAVLLEGLQAFMPALVLLSRGRVQLGGALRPNCDIRIYFSIYLFYPPVVAFE